MFIFFPCATYYGSRATSEHSKTLAYAVLSRSRVCWMCLLSPHTGNVSASRIGPSPRQPMRSPRSHKGGLNRYSLCRRIEKASGKDSSLVWYTSKVIHMIAWWRPLDASLVSAAVRPSRIGNVVGQALPACGKAILGYETAISFQRRGCVSNVAAGRDASGDCRRWRSASGSGECDSERASMSPFQQSRSPWRYFV